MSQFFEIHPEQPQLRLIRQAVEILRKGGLIAVPTDAAYSLVGHTGDAAVIDRIRRIRGVDVDLRKDTVVGNLNTARMVDEVVGRVECRDAKRLRQYRVVLRGGK